MIPLPMSPEAQRICELLSSSSSSSSSLRYMPSFMAKASMRGIKIINKVNYKGDHTPKCELGGRETQEKRV